jgi:hypothetical protein
MNPSRSNKYLGTYLARVFTSNRTRVQGLERGEGRFPTVWLADLATDKPHRQNGPKLAFPCRQLVVLATYREKRRKLESVHRKGHQLKSLHPCLPGSYKSAILVTIPSTVSLDNGLPCSVEFVCHRPANRRTTVDSVQLPCKLVRNMTR